MFKKHLAWREEKKMELTPHEQKFGVEFIHYDAFAESICDECCYQAMMFSQEKFSAWVRSFDPANASGPFMATFLDK